MPTFPLNPYRPPLAPPALLEAERLRLARELENYLEALTAYCDEREADEHLSEAAFQHVYALRQFVGALGRYDQNAELLLDYYRQGLDAARQQALAQAPTLEQALGLPPVPAPDGDRARAPLYRLGWCRGYRKAQAQYEGVVRLYAAHAVLPAPPAEAASPLRQRLPAYLASPAVQQLGQLPAATRRAIPTLPLPPFPRPDAEPEQAAA